MFRVSLTNFGTLFAEEFASFDAAVAFAKSKGFECTLYDAVGVAGTWSPIGGSKDWRWRR